MGEAPGRRYGRGLIELGLEPGAVVSEQQLEALFARSLQPVTGSRLGRARRTDGVIGFDVTFSAPKSVRALWALGDRSSPSVSLSRHDVLRFTSFCGIDAVFHHDVDPLDRRGRLWEWAPPRLPRCALASHHRGNLASGAGWARAMRGTLQLPPHGEARQGSRAVTLARRQRARTRVGETTRVRFMTSVIDDQSDLATPQEMATIDA